MPRVTGSVITVARKSGDIYFLKARDRHGHQIKKRLGPVGDWSDKQAADALRDWLTDLGRAPEGPRERVTLDEAARAWLHYLEHEKQRAPSTLGDYRNTIRRNVIDRLGSGTPVASITTGQIDELRRELLRDLSPRTVQKTLVLFHGLMRFAVRRRWAVHNPAADAERVTVRRAAEFAVLSPVEVQAAARATTDPQLAALILTAGFTGLRLGELRALRWRDVDFGNRIVHVRRAVARTDEKAPKSWKARSVPLIDQAAVALDGLSRRERFTGLDDLVFPNAIGGRLHDAQIREGFYAALQAAGIPRDRGTGKPLVFHDLRHSFGTLAVQAFPLSDVKAYMGHADIATTMLYVHHTPQHDAADKLSALVAAPAAPVGATALALVR